MKYILLMLTLIGCATVQEKDVAYVAEILSCDRDEDYDAEWCVVVLDDERWAGVPSWDINEGDRVVCEMRGELTCVKDK